MVPRRVVFDFEIQLVAGGRLQGWDFRLDIEGDALDDRALADRLVVDLRLATVASVRITNRRVVDEPQQRPATPSALPAGTIVDLSHVIRDGMVTYPGLPGPALGTHLSRQESRTQYAPGTEFHIGTISMVANTGTYLDTPFHRYPGGVDLAGLPAASCVDVEGVVVRAVGRRAVDADAFADVDPWKRAILVHTGWDRHFATPAYAVEAPFLTEAAARRLVDGGATLVGIDSVNIDDISGPMVRPVHSILLAAGIPIVEHLTGLERLPDRGFTVTAVAPRVEGMGTFPVRAVARITG